MATFPTVHLTADQVARAMETDEFFSDYGQSTLLIQGTVAAVSHQDGDLVVELATSVPTKIDCDLGSGSSPIQAGDRITVVSTNPQQDASRSGGGVVIRNCRVAAS